MNGDPTISRRRVEALQPIIDAAMALQLRVAMAAGADEMPKPPFPDRGDWTLPGCLVLMILVAAIIGGIMWALK